MKREAREASDFRLQAKLAKLPSFRLQASGEARSSRSFRRQASGEARSSRSFRLQPSGEARSSRSFRLQASHEARSSRSFRASGSKEASKASKASQASQASKASGEAREDNKLQSFKSFTLKREPNRALPPSSLCGVIRESNPKSSTLFYYPICFKEAQKVLRKELSLEGQKCRHQNSVEVLWLLKQIVV